MTALDAPPEAPGSPPEQAPSPSLVTRASIGGRAAERAAAREPGRPMLLLGWLRGRSDRMWPLPIPVWLYVAVSVPVTIGLGIWGFVELHLSPKYNTLEAVYHAIKLYTLDLGPAAGGSGSPDPNWQLWVALLLAALLVLRGLVGLLRRHLQGWASRYVLRRHVIVCGGGVHGASLVKALSGQHEVVLVDPDPGAIGMHSPHGKYEWRLEGDAVRTETLLRAGVKRAHWVVAMSGNDFVNTQIVSAMRKLAAEGDVRRRVQVLVQVEDPVLARFLEEQETDEAHAGRMFVSPFSANAIAAEALLQQSPVKLAGSEPRGKNGEEPMGTLLQMRGRKAPNLLLAGNHPLIDALFLAALRRWRVRMLRDAEANATYVRPPLHISVFGPGAVERVEHLRSRWRPEPHVLAIDVKDAEPEEGISAEIEEWLRQEDRADHAIVVCNEEVDGVGMALRISRALGNSVLMTRVSTELESALDAQLKERTRRSEHFATTDVKSIAELACEPQKMRRLSGRERLLGALSPRRPKDQGDGDGERDARDVVERFFERETELGIRSDSTWRIVPCERAMLGEAAKPVPISALVRAGLRIDLAQAGTIRRAAEQLSAQAAKSRAAADGQAGRVADELTHAAVAAWCEYIRHVTSDSPDAVRDELGHPVGDPVADRLMRLRRATLGERDGLGELEPDGRVLAGAERVAIFAGPAGSAGARYQKELLTLLKGALRAYDGTILSGGTNVGLPGAVGIVANEKGIPLIGYTPPNRADRQLYEHIRETPEQLYGPGDPTPRPFSIREPLAMWTDILRAGISPRKVFAVVFRGGPVAFEELLLARALGAQVAWLDPEGTETAALEDLLPLGSMGVLELPADPMTVRAFITQSKLSEKDVELRERVARFLHNDYRRKQSGRKPPGDPALAHWDDLLESLKASNRAAADDIPNKLALIGKRLVRGGAPLELSPAEVELLAEAEHGRWNVERLLQGWQLGDRDIGRGASPDLKCWDELADDTREYDREAVRNIAPALAEAGWGVGPL